MPYCRRLLQTDIFPQKLSRLNWIDIFVAVVGERVHEDGDAEFGPADGVGDRALVAEVRERDEEAVDLVAVRLEEIGAGARVGEAFDRAEFRRLGVERDRAEPRALEGGEHLGAAGGTQMRGKKASITDDDAERRRSAHGQAVSGTGRPEAITVPLTFTAQRR